MKITIQMPEILIMSSILMYSQSRWLSLGFMLLGIVASLVKYSMSRYDKQESEKKTQKVMEDYKNALISAIPITTFNIGGKKETGTLN